MSRPTPSLPARAICTATLIAALGATATPSPAQGAGFECDSVGGLIELLDPIEEPIAGLPDDVEDFLGVARKVLRRLKRRFASRCVHLNEVQVLGSHNSYHIRPVPELQKILLEIDGSFTGFEYTHLPLRQQFRDQGIRQIELDVFADPDGGLYRKRVGRAFIGLDPDSGIAELDEPGFKVLHVQDVDFETTCLTLEACLRQIKRWSGRNPGHLPIVVLIEAKDEIIPFTELLDFTVPIPFDAALFRALDEEIRDVFPANRLITPDDVRGERATLEEAVLTDGWPTLKKARGKILFALDNGGAARDAYKDGAESLEGRVLFTDSSPGNPDAAFVKANDPTGDPDLIPDLVRAGYIVRTRADADTEQARTDDTTQRDLAIASGAQYVSTDYPVPDPGFGTDYRVEIPGGQIGRCNPVNAPVGCRDSLLDR